MKKKKLNEKAATLKRKASAREEILPGPRLVELLPKKASPGQTRAARREAGRVQMAFWFDAEDIKRLDYLSREWALCRTDVFKNALRVAMLAVMPTG